MDSERWEHIQNLFHQAIGCDPEERDEFIERICGQDSALKQEILALLAAHQRATGFLKQGALPEEDPDELQTEHIGSYRLQRRLGTGGMGLVYLAVRDDATFKKRVAIKLIKRGMDTEDILRRFRHERQTMAALDHPNIARLLDGGTTEDGLPYFVMEYIDGLPIDKYCDNQRLNTLERLKLFRAVCSAVQYAHQNLVVHRDIKPGNIMVTADGTPKLLDFGIAKFLNPELTMQSIRLTRERMQLMTPEYSSPEQIRGQPITTATDVYSLGILLYELLTGHRPYRFKTRSPTEIERVICEQEPEKPSTAVRRIEEVKTADGMTTTLTPDTVSKTREGEPEKLKRKLSGDLDTIILMAMRKEPQRRYASVEQFSEDIRRHLEGLPVLARKDTFTYRSSTFVKRHRGSVTAAIFVFIMLLVGIAGTTWQASIAEKQGKKAEQRFNDVRKLANSLVFELHDAIKDLPGSTPARKLLVKRALEYLDGLAREADDDPSLQQELALAYQKIGDVQGNPNNANLGDTAGAYESYRKAIQIAKQLITTNPGDSEAQRTLAVIYEKMSDVQSWTGNVPLAVENSRKSLALYETLAKDDLNTPRNKQSLAISYIKLGDILGNPNFPNVGKIEEALQNYQYALNILQSLSWSDSSNVTVRRYLGLVHERIGTIFDLKSDPETALQSYHASLTIRKELFRDYPYNYDIHRDLAVAYEKMADVHRTQGDRVTALEDYKKSLEIFKTLLMTDPNNANAKSSVCISYEKVGDVFAEMAEIKDAVDMYRESLTWREQLLGADPTNPQRRLELATTLKQLSTLFVSLGNVSAARRYGRRMLNTLKVAVDGENAEAHDFNNYAWALLTCDPAGLRDVEAALAYAQKANRMANGKDPNILDTLALAYHLNGDHANAVEIEESAITVLDEDSALHTQFEANLKKFEAALNSATQ